MFNFKNDSPELANKALADTRNALVRRRVLLFDCATQFNTDVQSLFRSIDGDGFDVDTINERIRRCLVASTNLVAKLKELQDEYPI